MILKIRISLLCLVLILNLVNEGSLSSDSSSSESDSDTSSVRMVAPERSDSDSSLSPSPEIARLPGADELINNDPPVTYPLLSYTKLLLTDFGESSSKTEETRKSAKRNGSHASTSGKNQIPDDTEDLWKTNFITRSPIHRELTYNILDEMYIQDRKPNNQPSIIIENDKKGKRIQADEPDPEDPLCYNDVARNVACWQVVYHFKFKDISDSTFEDAGKCEDHQVYVEHRSGRQEKRKTNPFKIKNWLTGCLIGGMQTMETNTECSLYDQKMIRCPYKFRTKALWISSRPGDYNRNDDNLSHVLVYTDMKNVNFKKLIAYYVLQKETFHSNRVNDVRLLAIAIKDRIFHRNLELARIAAEQGVTSRQIGKMPTFPVSSTEASSSRRSTSQRTRLQQSRVRPNRLRLSQLPE